MNQKLRNLPGLGEGQRTLQKTSYSKLCSNVGVQKVLNGSPQFLYEFKQF